MESKGLNLIYEKGTKYKNCGKISIQLLQSVVLEILADIKLLRLLLSFNLQEAGRMSALFSLFFILLF